MIIGFLGGILKDSRGIYKDLLKNVKPLEAANRLADSNTTLNKHMHFSDLRNIVFVNCVISYQISKEQVISSVAEGNRSDTSACF